MKIYINLKYCQKIIKKTKRRLPLICFTCVVFVILFILVKPKKVKIDEENLLYRIINEKDKTLFNIKNLDQKDLFNKIVLLNIYNMKDFSYIFSLELINKIEKIYKDKVFIIDVISNDFKINKNVLFNYIIKNNIERPIIEIQDTNKIDYINKNMNYFVLINKNFKEYKSYTLDDIEEENIINDIRKLINSSNIENINSKTSHKIETVIKSLSQIKYIPTINSVSLNPYFIVSDAEGRKIYILTINGIIINQIGNKKGNKNGVGFNASFCYPNGISVENNEFLYVADICNNQIKKIDLKTLEVSTFLNVNKPIDLEYLDGNLIISTEDRKLLNYNILNEEINEIKTFNNPINYITKYKDKVYFITNKILYSYNNKEIAEEFNFLNLTENINLKNNFYIDETGIYIPDKFKNKILKIDIDNNNLTTYSSNDKNNIYDYPTNIVSIKDKFYITNENKEELISIDKYSKEKEIVKLSFGYEYNKEKSNEEFLNINNLDEICLNPNNKNTLKINLDENFSIEKKFPTYIKIYKENLKDKTAILVKKYKKNEILNSDFLDLPKFTNKEVYYLQGEFYFYNKEDKKIYFDEYKIKINIKDKCDNNVIDLNLGTKL